MRFMATGRSGYRPVARRAERMGFCRGHWSHFAYGVLSGRCSGQGRTTTVNCIVSCGGSRQFSPKNCAAGWQGVPDFRRCKCRTTGRVQRQTSGAGKRPGSQRGACRRRGRLAERAPGRRRARRRSPCAQRSRARPARCPCRWPGDTRRRMRPQEGARGRGGAGTGGGAGVSRGP